LRAYSSVLIAFWASTLAMVGYAAPAMLGYTGFGPSCPLTWLGQFYLLVIALPVLVKLHLWAYRRGSWCYRLFNALAVSAMVVLVAMIPFIVLLELSGV